MKFLILTNHSYMLWQFRHELIEKLHEFGDVVISMPFVGHEDDFEALGIKCIETDIDRRGINPKTDLGLYFKYKDIIESERPNMVITYSIKPNIYGGYACKKLGVPYCVNVQGLGTAFQNEPIASIVTLMYKIALKKAKTVFFENVDNAKEFVDKKIIPVSKETVLHGAGVNLDVYKQQKYPSEENGIHFLFLGRIMKEKGIDELFYCARKLKELYGAKIQIDVVGFFEDEYKKTVEDLSKRGIIEFYGFQSDPKPFYENAHCVVLPSYHEGMSNVLLEAAATGRAVITTDIPGCREAVDDGINGFLCERMNAESLLTQMKRFVNLTEFHREAMGLSGRRKIEKEFSKADVINDTISAILKCN